MQFTVYPLEKRLTKDLVRYGSPMVISDPDDLSSALERASTPIEYVKGYPDKKNFVRTDVLIFRAELESLLKFDELGVAQAIAQGEDEGQVLFLPLKNPVRSFPQYKAMGEILHDRYGFSPMYALDAFSNPLVTMDDSGQCIDDVPDLFVFPAKPFTLYVNPEAVQSARNASYPKKRIIRSTDDLKRAVAIDHVAALFKDGYTQSGKFVKSHRAVADFLAADGLMLDLDNDHSENPDEWITPNAVAETFADVEFYASPSRNDGKPKHNKAPRPKKHYYFALSAPEDDYKRLDALRTWLCEKLPFDRNARDSARFFFAVPGADPVYYPGTMCIDEWAAKNGFKYEPLAEGVGNNPLPVVGNNPLPVVGNNPADHSKEALYDIESYVDALNHLIPLKFRDYDKWRNLATSCKVAGISMETFKQWSDRDTAKSMKASEWPGWWKSLQPGRIGPGYLVECAVKVGWVKPAPDPVQSARRDFSDSEIEDDGPVSVSDCYTPKDSRLIPEAFTDVGQARLFWERYGGCIRYCNELGWLHYQGGRWRRDALAVTKLLQEMTWEQQALAKSMIMNAQKCLLDAKSAGDREAEDRANQQLETAKSFFAFTLKTQLSGRMNGTLTQTAAMAAVRIEELDSYPHLLNTEGGVVDLRSGKIMPHDPELLLTKMCPVIPGTKGTTMWKAFLQDLTDNDESMIDYLQRLCGMAAFGRVYEEKLFMVVGPGGNGKSTFFNVVSDVFGDYATGLPAKLLTMAWNRNEQNDYARLRGMRLAVAKEMDRNQRLSESTVKQLCATDDVLGEFKYHDTFQFTPSHSLILFTNNTPTVSGMDDGIWRRLEQVPLLHKFSGMDGEVMNYREALFQECAPSILQWIIDGAVRFEMAGHKLEPCERVREASLKYRHDNDVIFQFVQARCYEEPGAYIRSQDAYQEFASFLMENGFTWKPKAGAFKEMMVTHGFKYGRSYERGRFFSGLRLRGAGEPEPDDDGEEPGGGVLEAVSF